jgi:hypothetical protein
VVVVSFSLVAMRAPALARSYFVLQVGSVHWLVRSVGLALASLIIYAVLWCNFIYEAIPSTPTRSMWARPTPKLIAGFLPIKEVGDLMWGEDRIIGLTYERALEEASYDPDLVWKPWTVRLNQAAFLLAWLGIFVGVGMASTASVPISRLASPSNPSQGSGATPALLISPGTRQPSATLHQANAVQQSTEPVSIFYSYSHKDEELRKQLEEHLALLKRQGVISGWHDRQVLAGTESADQIGEHLESARIILLLVSSSFLASDYSYGKEMERALDRHDRGEARVIPIILRPCDWHGARFANLQALPKDAKAVTLWTNLDEAFTNVAEGIREVVEAIRVADANRGAH